MGRPFSYSPMVCGVFAGVLVGTFFCAGCNDHETSELQRRRRDLGVAAADAGETLLQGELRTLADLPRFVVLDLRPPEVVLDATKTRDNRDAMAVIQRDPNGPPGNPANYLRVVTNNGRFRTLDVQSGDIVRYFARNDPEREQIGIAEKVAVDLTVQRVVNENVLLLNQALERPFLEPQRIEVWRFSDVRLNDASGRLERYIEYRDPPFGWEPSPDETILIQVVDGLNEWLRSTESDPQWKPTALLDGLPADLRAAPPLDELLTPDALGRHRFNKYDGRLLQQAVWLRDIANWARGSALGDVEKASALFDWVVRNVQLEAADAPTAEQFEPWQILMYGHGTAAQRVWIFAELCRHQNLDVVAFSVPVDQGVVQLAALVSEEQLYLFDPQLGLAIAGPGGEGVATLSDVRQDDSLLRQLDLPEQPYPLSATSLAAIEAEIVASPLQVTRRAQILQSRLTRKDALILAAAVDPLQQALSQLDGVERVSLWKLPWQTVVQQNARKKRFRRQAAAEFQVYIWRPALWKARVLHFQGRQPDQSRTVDPSLADAEDSHGQAIPLYNSVRPSHREIKKNVTSETRREIYLAAKQSASYWLGLLMFERGAYEPAADYFWERCLKAFPDGPWTAGARVNLARTYEELGRYEDAIRTYREDRSPQRHGSLLRAQRLARAAEAAQPETSDDTSSAGSP